MSEIFAELGLSILRARVRSGMENAREKGKHIGRPQTTKDDIPAIFYGWEAECVKAGKGVRVE